MKSQFSPASPSRTDRLRSAAVVAIAAVASFGFVSSGIVPGGPTRSLLGLPSGNVEVVEVDATVEVRFTDAPASAGPIEPINLPHCAFTSLSNDGAILHIWGAPWDPSIGRVVLVHYSNGSSFSGGGDDTKVLFLRPWDVAEVPAAFHRSSVLYRVAGGPATPLIPILARATGPLAFDGNYVVNGTLLVPDFPETLSGNISVTEHHSAQVFHGVKVHYRGQGLCA